jgi:hypothetical protein
LAIAHDDLVRLVYRLRNLSVGAWRGRRAAVVLLVDQLAALSAQLEHRGAPKLPELADHVLTDAVAVIGGDVLDALSTDPDLASQARALADIRAALEATR